MRSTGTAYLLWLLSLFGFAGFHRFYAGKPLTGLLWFFTLGLFFVGTFVDLFLIPSMVERANLRSRVSQLEFDARRVRPAY